MATGVIGLGNIGGAIAANLVADGNDVVVYDVDPAAVQAITGATAAPDVASVAGQADVTLLSLPTPDVVSEVAAAWAGAAAPGAVLVDLSTNSPAVVRELGERLAASGHHLVEAPLTGGAIGAEKRMLVFMVGGDDEPVARVIPVLEPLGRATFHVGPLGLGNTMKLLNSLIAFTTTWVSLEGLAMATKAGIDAPEGGGDPAHRRGVQLLHRSPGRDHRRPQPAHAVRVWSWRRRMPVSLWRPATPWTHRCRSAGRSRGCSTPWCCRGSAGPTGASSSPSPNGRPTSRCAGTPSRAWRKGSGGGSPPAAAQSVPSTSAATRMADPAAGTPA